MLQILRGCPEPVVDRAAVGLVRLRRDRDERTDQTHLGDPLQLFGTLIRIVDIEHRDALEAPRMRLAEIGDPVVVAAADLRQELAVRDAVPEEALARLQYRPPDAVLLV